MKRALSGALCALMLSGCMTTQPAGDAGVTVEEVLRAVKHDVDQYNAYAAASAKAPRKNNHCNSKVDLPITAVTIKMTTATTRSGGWSVGAEGSPTPYLKLSAGGGQSYKNESSQVLTFTVTPLPTPTTPETEPAKSPSALYLTLRDLRESMLRAGDYPPCFTFPPSDKQDNSIEFAFAATRDTSVSTGINFFIVAIAGSKANQQVAAHTITVHFEGAGVFLQ